MDYPSLCFVDARGNELPWDGDTQYIRQYGGWWRIRVRGEWQGGVALIGEPPFPLIRGSATDWKLPENMTGDEKKRVTSTGQVTAVLLHPSGNIVSASPQASLFVTPTNITEQQLNQMIAEIGILALSTASCVTRQLSVPAGEGVGIGGVGLQWLPSSGHLATATALLELASVVKNNWAAIEKRPLRSFITKVAPVDIKRVASSPQLLIKSKVEPAKRQMLGFTRVESVQCPENEFICYVLDIYLKDLANGLAKVLESLNIEDALMPPIRTQSAEVGKFIDQAGERVRILTQQRKEERKRIAETISQLRNCAEWATYARNTAFLEEVVTPDSLPAPSQRLIGSLAYGSIFEQYSNCGVSSISAIQRVLHLFESTYQGQVRPTWEIYEIWCFARLYSVFTIYANMKPPNGEPTMFERLQIENGMLHIPKNQIFKLQGCLDNGKEFSVKLWYQFEARNNEGKLRIPDILLQISIDGLRQLYCFDPKYRNYKKQTSSQLVEDVIGVARDKYLEPLKAKASFILHTDRQVDYWGEVPFNKILEDQFNCTTNAEGAAEYAKHRYGAIALVPGASADRQLNKIIRLLFQYHGSLPTACLSCGHQLESGTDVRTSWMPDGRMRGGERELIRRVVAGEGRSGNGTALYCSCPKCGNFWVVQHCYGNHHRILKFRDCFHRPSDYRAGTGSWMYICPVCGSDPPPQAFR